MYNGGWLKIEDNRRFLSQFEPMLIHPDDPRWITFWRDRKKKIIEGIWFEDFGKWRYGRGNLGFFHHYCRLPDLDLDHKTHGKMIKPLIRDLEWHRSYYMAEAMGFSGFSEDDNYTSDWSIFNVDKNKLPISDIKNLRYFKSNGDFKEFIPPRENLYMLHDKPLGIPQYYNNAKNHVELGARGGGKAAPLYTKIPTPDGFTTMGELKPGSIVFNRYGKHTKVVAVHPQGAKEIFKVRFKDGKEVECCEDHLWVVRFGKNEKVMSVKDMLNKGSLKYENKRGGVWKFRIPTAGEVEYSYKELPIDPYVLGVLLGDGTLTTATPKVAIGDKEILEYLKCKLEGFEFSYDKSTNNNHTIVDRQKEAIYIDTSEVERYSTKGYYTKGGNRLTTEIRKLGLNVSCKEKFIPEIYMQASVEQRYELLRGLMDTDGSCTSEGSSEFTSTNKRLAEQVLKLARSLGIVSQLGVDDRSDVLHEIKGHVCYKPLAYRVYLNTTKPIFKIRSKGDRLKNKPETNMQKYIPIVAIEATGEFTEMQCITVEDETSTYLTDDFVVTHNSLYYILGEVKYALVTDGAKFYNDEIRLKPPAIKINVGSGIKSKSSDTLIFMEQSMNNLKLDPDCGVWGEPDDEKAGGVYEPCPFWKDMRGSFDTDATDGWCHTIEKKEGNMWIKHKGSAVFHKSYSANKKTGAEAGAGGRRTIILYEEIGLFEDLLSAWASDEAVVSIDGVQFAPRIGIGTSGNIDTIKAAKQIMTHPDLYNCLEFPGETQETKQCFFLPATIVDKRFKDSNGNTDILASNKFYSDELEEKLKTNDSTIINGYKMNKPTKVDHMWVSKTGDLLPVREAELREKQLLRNNLYESIGTPIKLFYDPNQPTGIGYEVDPSIEPFYDDNYSDRATLDGGVVMYEQPFSVNGVIPVDAHIITHDPYVSDAWDEGGSLGVTHVWINPKYIPQGAKGNCLAATYIGKHRKGVDGYNEELEKLCQFYGNPFRQLWYESNRGDRLRSYLLKKQKAFLMCLQPQFEQGNHIYLRNTNKTGFVVGSQVAKISMIDRLNEWLLEETQLNGEDTPLQNIFRISCIFTIRQIKAYDLKGNYDAVSSVLGLPLALGEIQHRIHEIRNPAQNPLRLMTKYLKQRIGER